MVYEPGVYPHMMYNDIMYNDMYVWCMWPGVWTSSSRVSCPWRSRPPLSPSTAPGQGPIQHPYILYIYIYCIYTLFFAFHQCVGINRARDSTASPLGSRPNSIVYIYYYIYIYIIYIYNIYYIYILSYTYIYLSSDQIANVSVSFLWYRRERKLAPFHAQEDLFRGVRVLVNSAMGLEYPQALR
jgi:hypothetical protein